MSMAFESSNGYPNNSIKEPHLVEFLQYPKRTRSRLSVMDLDSLDVLDVLCTAGVTTLPRFDEFKTYGDLEDFILEHSKFHK